MSEPPATSVDDRSGLRADCERCFGLCCVALPFAVSADFALDKPAGTPCPNLRGDHRCGIHAKLRPSGFTGCTVYDCFGAGQRVSQVTFGGHGVGRTMHESPSVPNEGRPGRGMRLVPGLVIAIEPWFLGGGSDRYRIDKDGWTLRSADGSRAAHVEHTVAITDDGPQILTAP